MHVTLLLSLETFYSVTRSTPSALAGGNVLPRQRSLAWWNVLPRQRSRGGTFRWGGICDVRCDELALNIPSNIPIINKKKYVVEG